MGSVLAEVLWVGLGVVVWTDVRRWVGMIVDRWEALHPIVEPAQTEPAPGFVLKAAEQQGPEWAQQEFLALVQEAYTEFKDWHRAIIATQDRIERESHAIEPHEVGR